MTDLDTRRNNFSVLCCNLLNDFNIATVVRNSNAFLAKEVLVYGNKRYDRRGTVGTHNYTDVIHLKTRDQLLKLKEDYELVAVENSVPSAVALGDAQYNRPPMFILGEEGVGITPETLELCDKFVYIKQHGSVRSLNAAVAGSIIMNHYVNEYLPKNAIKD
jgi:tRNA G18 (ribose-2'-O)-methylase SpoU